MRGEFAFTWRYPAPTCMNSQAVGRSNPEIEPCLEKSIEADPVTFEVMRADRRFPMLPDARHSPPRNRIRELQVQPTDETLPGRLSQAISQRLAWHEIPFAQNPDRETVVGAYVNSLKQLAAFQNDVETLVFEVCRANLEFRQGAGETHAEARDAILKAKLDEMTDQAFSEGAGCRRRIS